MIFWERQKSLTAFYEACTKPVRDAYDLTQMQFNILMFLHNNPQFDTAHYAAGNRKSQHLRITKSAEAVIAAGKAAQEVFGKQLFKGFTPRETEQYKVLFDKMCENAAEGLAETERMN